MPVMIAARLGAHTGAVVNARVYRTDSFAKRSRVGVRARVSPYAPRRGLMSSFEIQTMFTLARGGCARSCPAAVGPHRTDRIAKPAQNARRNLTAASATAAGA